MNGGGRLLHVIVDDDVLSFAIHNDLIDVLLTAFLHVAFPSSLGVKVELNFTFAGADLETYEWLGYCICARSV